MTTTSNRRTDKRSARLRKLSVRSKSELAAAKEGGYVSKRPNTAIACCIGDELSRYFDLLDGEPPADLYRMVIRQAEHALLDTVMRETGGNQTKAALWLGISRGNLRNKLADMENS